jgi:raffinose/stachyose/melibiose transport system permease protein
VNFSRPTGRRRRRGRNDVPWLLALPAVAALFAFHFVPVAFGGYYAFTDWDGLGHASWIGLRNFRDIAGDRFERAVLWRTLELAGLFVVLVNAIGLALALALNRAIKTRNVLRVLFFAPVALSPLAIAFVWEWIFAPDGALNRLLGSVGLSSLQRSWTGDPSTALWTVLVVLVWQFTGLTMVLYLAGLQQIPEEIEEAALVDGASAWLRFRKIVLPLLAPAITVSVTLTFVIGMRVFDQVFALTRGGPVRASETLGYEVWKQTFELGRWGYGAAFSVILTIVVLGLALIQLTFLRMNERRL